MHAKKSRPSLRPDQRRSRPKRRRKVVVRSKPVGDSRRALSADAELSPLARLIDALRAEKTRFIVVGMTGAVLQGTPVTTFDVDLWIDLLPRQYMRMINLARSLGAQMVSN